MTNVHGEKEILNPKSEVTRPKKVGVTIVVPALQLPILGYDFKSYSTEHYGHTVRGDVSSAYYRTSSSY